MGNNIRDILFSIIVPVYNVEEYLNRCMESIINQSYKNIEIILVDDGSTDNCPEMCDSFAKRDKRIKAFHKNNGGLSDARNFGLRKAKGDYILFVDSDDFIELDTCNIFNSILKSHPNIDILAANCRRLDDLITIQKYTSINQIVDGRDFLKFQFCNGTMHIAAWRNLYRTRFLTDNILYFKFGIVHEDEEWTPRVFLKAKSVKYADYIHYYHIIRENSITQQKVKTKNALDLISACLSLGTVYKGIEDQELKILLYDYLATLYLHAFFIGKLIGRKNKKIIDKRVLKNLAHSSKNKRRVSFFYFSRSIYYYYYYFRINYLSRTALKKFVKSFRRFTINGK